MSAIDLGAGEEQRSSYTDPLVFERLLKGADFIMITGSAWYWFLQFGRTVTPGFMEFAALSSVFLGFFLLLCLRELGGYRVAFARR